jgi:hypothetical protein
LRLQNRQSETVPATKSAPKASHKPAKGKTQQKTKDGKPKEAGPSNSAGVTNNGYGVHKSANPDGMNRRERRKVQFAAKEAAKASNDGNESDGGFFDM